jgi:hypothetical protein
MLEKLGQDQGKIRANRPKPFLGRAETHKTKAPSSGSGAVKGSRTA